jgi:hypothetical protein
VSLSTDHTTNSNCDPFVAMRILFSLHQHRIGAKIPLTLKRLVQLATLDGAVDLNIPGRTGSLTPGKRADIILVRTGDINMTPAGDPYEALVSRAQPGTIDTVIVDGRILRQSGKFTALDHARCCEAQEAAGAAHPRQLASGVGFTYRFEGRVPTPTPPASCRRHTFGMMGRGIPSAQGVRGIRSQLWAARRRCDPSAAPRRLEDEDVQILIG